MKTWTALLLASCAALASGCCCCGNPFSAVPDSAWDEAARQGVESATGIRVDEEEGRVRVRGPDGEIAVAGGQGAIDPRIPISPFPGCEVQGGATVEAEGRLRSAFNQPACEAELDEIASHFEGQISAAGGTAERSEMSAQSMRVVTVGHKSSDGSLREAQIVIRNVDRSGTFTVSAAITVVP